MKPSLFLRTLAPILTLSSLVLTGCGAAISMQSTTETPETVAGPGIQGSVFGGHAPIVGAHVYLAQPSTTGYGNPATSILGVSSGSFTAQNPPGYTLTANVSDPNVPVGAKYVTSDANGAFNLTGAYACTVGQPVFIYAYSGNIGVTTSSTTTTVSTAVTGIQVIGGGNNGGAGSTATYKFTVSPTETLTSGATVTISGLTGDFSIINGTQIVLGGGLSSTTFEFTATNRYPNPGGFGHLYIATGNYTTSDFGTAGQASYSSSGTTTNPPTNNNSIVQLATLGNCPSSGNFSTQGNGALSYVYLNEVSTIATAYTFKPFTLATNNSAWDIGSSGSTQALVGIANAANTAGQLYNIQGNATQSTAVGEGEGHLANYQTQSGSGTANSGNGAVPQATIDTLANILAACVDSTPPSGGGTSAACTTLFTNATADGLSTGTQPTDTGTAAINIARYPAGNWSSTAANPTAGYVKNLFNLPTGAVPYVPDLTAAPNDWTIAINYAVTAPAGTSASNSTLNRAESIAFDNIGQAWITAQGTAPANASVVRWSPLGLQNSFASKGYIYGYVSIDGANNAWAGNAASTTGIEEFGSNGVLTATYGSGYSTAYTLIATGASTTGLSDGVFFVAKNTATTPAYDLFAYGPSGAAVTGTPFSLSPSITSGNDVAHGAIDASGDLWLTSETSYQVARVTQTGTAATGFVGFATSQQPEFPSIDSAGNAWIAVQATPSVVLDVTPTGGITTLTPATTGALMSSTFGSAVDGNGDIWFANRSGNYGNQSGVGAAGTNTIFLINHTNDLAISPATNYVPETQYNGGGFTTMLYDSLNVAVDPSGNVWCTNYLGNAVVELVGAGTPTVTPLSVAAASNKIGQKP